jgi:glycosyltransferase involved in cell wall biosynthesis
MKISVVITHHNRLKELKKAVDSVIAQTLKDWELIIVDDCSKNDEKKLKNYFKKLTTNDSRIRTYVRSTNFGQHTRPKNEGSRMANAPYVAYLDDDNQYRRDHLQVLWTYMEKWKDDVDVVYGDRWLKDQTGRGRDCMGIASDFNFSRLSQQNYIDTSDVLIKKEWLERVGGWDETLPKFADWNLWVRLAKAGAKFKRVPIIITDYYVHQGCNQFKFNSGVDPNTGLALPTFEPHSCMIWPDKTYYGERPELRVAIFTLTMERLDYTKRMYKSMTKNAGYKFDWFVVDNASTDGTKEWLEGKVKVAFANSENYGISKGSNQALDMIGDKYDIIIKVDNDCEFLTEGWLKEIVDLFYRNKKLVVSPRVEGLRDTPGGVPRYKYIYVGEHFLGTAPHVGGICVAAEADIYKNFRWIENDFLHGEQDLTFSQHAIKTGHLLAYMENVIVEHMDSTEGQLKAHPEYEEERKIRRTKKYEKVSI